MTAAREAAEFAESVGTPTITTRVAGEFAESVGTPTIKTRMAAEFIEVVVGRSLGPAPPLALRRRPDDNSTGSPLLPRFHGTPQRSAALGAGSGW